MRLGALWLALAAQAHAGEPAATPPEPIPLLSGFDKLKAAVMIVHGEADVVAPFAQARELRDALDARKLPYQWLSKPGEGHGFYRAENREELYAKLLAFLDGHIGHRTEAPVAPGP